MRAPFSSMVVPLAVSTTLSTQALKEEPEKILDFFHYVFLSSSGENNVNYWSDEYHIDSSYVTVYYSI